MPLRTLSFVTLQVYFMQGGAPRIVRIECYRTLSGSTLTANSKYLNGL